MSLLLESILYQNGRFSLLDYHILRMEKCCREMGWEFPPDLDRHLKPSTRAVDGKYKVRILYNRKIGQSEWIPYQKASPERVGIVNAGDFSYSLKYADRSFFTEQKAKWSIYDDLIFEKKGLITDSSYCNLLARINDRWLTPAKPLLQGVRRSYLLDRGLVVTADLSPEHLLEKATEIRLINALMPFDDCIVLKPEQIFMVEGGG